MAAAITNHSRCVLLRLTDREFPRVHELDVVMLWADVCLFFGFLLSARGQSYSFGQFVPAVESSVHLTVSDVAVNSLSNPSVMRVRLMQSIKLTRSGRVWISISRGRVPRYVLLRQC